MRLNYIRFHAPEKKPERGAQDTEEICGVVGENGVICQYTGTKQAVAVHRATTHGQCNAVRALIQFNECPLCRKVFAGVKVQENT